VSLEFLQTDFDKVSYLVNLLTSRATGLAADPREFEVLRHEVLSNQKFSQLLPQWLRQHRTLDFFWGFIKQKFNTYAERRTFLSEQFTPVLDALEFGQPVQPAQMPASLRPGANSPPNSQVVARNKRKVFIVHGRDEGSKQEVARFIEKIGLEAIILHEQASAGMTIIEKIEHYSNNADFALVLYTACDLGRGVHETNMSPKSRARQNVVFEHGYLMAKLGRENVCALVKGQIETPNDISGVVYVVQDEYGAWKQEVARELKACGYAIGQLF
jgi:predicted nucleotide-binding protein